MGQYHKPVNLDKKQYINPHKFGDGLKMLEFGQGGLTVTALTVLLACSHNRGGGDLGTEHPVAGSWAGDRVAIIGDYTEDNDIPGINAREIADNIWGEDSDYTDISEEILDALLDDNYIRQEVKENLERGYWFGNADMLRSLIAKHEGGQGVS
jgi:hypothetical protein